MMHKIRTSEIRPLLLKAVEHTKGKTALDFGVGGGHETAYLLQQGYQVTAIDNFQEFLTELSLHEANLPYLSQLTAIHSNFETLTWHYIPKVDLFVALFSLGYIQPESFFDVWNNIVKAIKPGGFFVGHLYTHLIKNKQVGGYFVQEKKEYIPFMEKEDIQNLFTTFDIVYFEDARLLYEEVDCTSAPIIYSVIARKQ